MVKIDRATLRAGPQGASAEVRYRGEGLLGIEPTPVLSAGPAAVQVGASFLSPRAVDHFTVTAWVRCDRAVSPLAEYAAILGRFQDGAPDASEWLLGIDSSGRLFMATTGEGTTPRVEAPTALATGTWYHVAAEWSANGNAAIFLNGEPQANGVLEVPQGGSLPVVLGDTYPPSGAHAFLGRIDEIRIWNHAATGDWVASLYGAAPDKDEDGIFDGNDPDDNNDGIPDAWAYDYFGDPLSGSPQADSDADGMKDLEEYIAGSDPTDHLSQFIVGPFVRQVAGTRVRVEFEGLAGRVYQAFERPAMAGFNSGWTKASKPYPCLQDGPFSITIQTDQEREMFYCVTVKLAE